MIIHICPPVCYNVHVVQQAVLSSENVSLIMHAQPVHPCACCRGGFDDDGDRPPREELGPSKADTSSSWGADRTPRQPSPDRSSRGGFGDSYTDRDRKQSGGFADRYGEDRASSFADRGPSKADEEDRWSRKPAEPSSERQSRGVDRGSSFGAPRSDSGDRWARQSSPPAADRNTAAPTERRRLNLTARTAPPKELPPPAAPKKPEETVVAAPQEPAAALPPKPKSNPFGTARPREEVLKEQGRDWKREERALEHSRVKRYVPPLHSKCMTDHSNPRTVYNKNPTPQARCMCHMYAAVQ